MGINASATGWSHFHTVGGWERDFSLAELWRELTSNRLTIVESSYLISYSHTVLEETRTTTLQNPSNVRILERLLLGESAKCVALELEVAPSTVAAYCGGMLAAMGCSRRLASAPILLTQAVHAAYGLCDVSIEAAWSHQVRSNAWTVNLELPRRSLWPQLSEGEWAVASLMIQGMSHADVATLRGTSKRTIANQIGSVFKKLRVSGRCELRAKAVRESQYSTRNSAFHAA